MLEYLPHITDPIYEDVPKIHPKNSPPFAFAIFTLASSMRIPCKRGLWHRCPANRRSPRKSHRRRWTDQGDGKNSITGYHHGWCQTWLGNPVHSLYMEARREFLRLTICATQLGFLITVIDKACHIVSPSLPKTKSERC